MLLGVPVQVTSDTEFDDSSFDALASDDRVEVDYIVNSDGQRIATEVENEDDQSDSRSSLGLSPLSGPNSNRRVLRGPGGFCFCSSFAAMPLQGLHLTRGRDAEDREAVFEDRLRG